MFSEFLFELLRGVGPVDGFGSLVVIGDVVGESGFKSCRRDEMVGLQAFALSTGAVDLTIGDGESGKQMAGTAALIPRFVQHRLTWASWTRRLVAFTGLDGGFLIETDQPGPCLQERACLDLGVQHRARPLQERDRIMDVLPGVIAPGTQAFGGSASGPPC